MRPLSRGVIAVCAGAVLTGALLVGLTFLSRVEPPAPEPRDRVPVTLTRLDENDEPPPPPEHRPPPPPPPPIVPDVLPDPLATELDPPAIVLPPLEWQALDVDREPQLGGFVFQAEDLDERPHATVRIEPEYPFRARRRGITGNVEVLLLVQRDGTVGEFRIVSAEPPGIFEEAVREAVPRWRFEPGRIDGEPVTAWVSTVIRFQQEGR